ncbi:fibropellin-1-like [Mercenaria mercenaria]|uniref:fibropellin-1-like n=1 Tax=Mercenaria mercenaria TaxID=6596 RepID=UPI00234E3B62|nr:fibropellin-1-like [Mercenaria mercenaria]XP_045184509.2 fibropellin-1-like [Mercenaria mercenaria]
MSTKTANMGWTTLFLLVPLIHGALSLHCLQCSGISQPRHCKFVGECNPGEVCGVEEVINSYGVHVYNVGCITSLLCQNTSTHHKRSNNEVCLECCQGDLCNAQGCGEPGYPINRGPVCLSCSLQKDPVSCHTIEFCEPGDVCKHEVIREFGDTLYNIGCSSLLECKHDYQEATSIIGRDVTSVQEQSDIALRSMTEHVCSKCCDTDLCNKNCNGTTHASASDHCSSSPCMHGRCENTVNGFTCNCDPSYTGDTCDTYMGKCYNNPCVHGKCYENQEGYVCVCDTGYEGQLCDNMTDPCLSGLCNGTTNVTDHCSSSPCMHGLCENTVNGFKCNCDSSYTGDTCDTSSSPCVDKTVPSTCKLAASIVCQDKTHALNGGCMHYCGFC